MTRFKHIEIEGFLSILKPLVYHLDKPGITIIHGKNGTGKTTILSALAWAGWGTTMKGKKDPTPLPSITPKNFNGTKVKLVFEIDGVEMSITRCYKYKGKIDGTKGASRIIISNSQSKYKRDLQLEINTILGYSFKLFKSSVIFGQKLKRLIEQDGGDRDKVLEEVFDVLFIQKAKKLAEDKRQILRDKVTHLEPELNSLEQEIEHTRDVIKIYSNLYKEAKIKKKRDIKKLKTSISTLKSSTAKDIEKLLPLNTELQSLITKISKHKQLDSTRYNVLSNQILKLHFTGLDTRGKIDDVKQQVKELIGTTVKTKCSFCSSKLNTKAIKASKKKISSTISGLKSKLTKLVALDKLTSNNVAILQSEFNILEAEKLKAPFARHNIEKVKTLEYNLRKLENSIEFQSIQFKQLRKEVKDLKKSTSKDGSIKYISKLETQILKLEPLKKSRDKLQKELSMYDWVIKDPLSNSGLKAYIIDSMIGLINESINKYSRVMGWDIIFGKELNTARKSYYTKILAGDQELDYVDLSGGEQQMVNVFIAFTLDDIISQGKPTNLLFMDEVFESLDPDNIEHVINVITMKAKTKSVHVITHRDEFIKTNANKVLVTKHKGITRVRE